MVTKILKKAELAYYTKEMCEKKSKKILEENTSPHKKTRGQCCDDK